MTNDYQTTFNFDSFSSDCCPTCGQAIKATATKGRPRLFNDEKLRQLRSQWNGGDRKATGLTIAALARQEGVSGLTMRRYLIDGHESRRQAEATARESSFTYRASNSASTKWQHNVRRVLAAGGEVVEEDRARVEQLHRITYLMNKAHNLQGHDRMSVDHIQAVSNGGAQSFDNSQIITMRENLQKGISLDWVNPRH